MESKKIIKIVLFNLLIILTIIFIFLLFFPKKSYIETMNININDNAIENNIKKMKIASLSYFEKNDAKKVTLKELIDKELLPELKDDNGEPCSNDSYAEKNDEKLTINLVCGDKKETRQINLDQNQDNKLICIYEYKKEKAKDYTDWGEWSEWKTEKVEQNDLTNVETKTEKISDGTKTNIVEDTISKPAIENTRITCPPGYEEINSQCKTKTRLNTITASVSYSCPNGYKKNGVRCYNDVTSINAEKNYYCPTGDKYIEFELSGSQCLVYRISYSEKTTQEKYYTCEEGYKLSENACYKTIQYEEEVENYKEITYYRYQTRKEKEKKYDIKWSIKNDKELLEQEYNMVREITCDF